MCNMRSCNHVTAEGAKLESNHFGILHRNLDARNCHYRYHPPPKVIISSPYMPTLCIENAKYDNLQSIWWSTRLFGVHSLSEISSINFQCKEFPWTVWYITKSQYQNPRYADAMHRGCRIWQSASNLMHSEMNYNENNFGTKRPEGRHKELPLRVPSTP
jgi:hypothetical protein